MVYTNSSQRHDHIAATATTTTTAIASQGRMQGICPHLTAVTVKATVNVNVVTVVATVNVVTTMDAVDAPTDVCRLFLHMHVQLPITQSPALEIYKQPQRDEVQDPVTDQPIQHERIGRNRHSDQTTHV